jgi:hypothetical protein
MTFNEWLQEIEVFSARYERLLSDLDFKAIKSGKIDEEQFQNALLAWLRASYEVGQKDKADRVEKLEKALELYEREHNRFKHAYPEITGAYYLTGGHGERDNNKLPQYVQICPAYGCAWEQIYERTEKTISYEGS